MSTERISVRIPVELGQRLRKVSSKAGQSESELVREALEQYLDDRQRDVSAYELAKRAGVLGSVRGLPKDLSTNRKYFEGFGESK